MPVSRSWGIEPQATATRSASDRARPTRRGPVDLAVEVTSRPRLSRRQRGRQRRKHQGGAFWMGDGAGLDPTCAASPFQVLERRPHGLLNHAQLPRRCVVRARDQVPPSRRERRVGADLGESPIAVTHPQRERAGGRPIRSANPAAGSSFHRLTRACSPLSGVVGPDPGLHGEAAEPGERRGIGHHRTGPHVRSAAAGPGTRR